MDIVTEDMLREITKAIVDAVHPLKVILFGSYVKGYAGPESALDFMVVEDAPFGASRSRRREIGNIHRHLKGFRIPMDVLVYSKDELEIWTGARNHVISHAVREGRVMYERA
ncbi:MAG: nucleotidyltransferase domain-containing protein [Thermodesulfovibrionales bacterium]|jgi:predicted nucleotidyltransferase